MKKNTKWITIITIMILFCSLPALIHAQGPFDQQSTTQSQDVSVVTAPDPGTCPTCPAAGPVPIDGGLSLLIAAGIGYGVKRARDSRKKKQDQANDEAIF